jgi:ribonuclease HII
MVMRPSYSRERALLVSGLFRIAGCDEAGRGPLAGPVVAAAVVLNPKRIPKGLNDSKKLTKARREELHDAIMEHAMVAVASASPARIERDNILRASLWALASAVRALPEPACHALVDGKDRIAVDCGCDAVIGGDAKVASIAAASIVAKVVRDRLMTALADTHPEYGFERHVGYGTPQHMTALKRFGPTPHHRRGFAPIAALLASSIDLKIRMTEIV